MVLVVGWRGSWVLLQALELAVNLSSETLSNETLKIAEMLKKRRGGVEWGCNTLSSMSNTRKDIFIHLFFSFHFTHNISFFYIIFLLSISIFSRLRPCLSVFIFHSLMSSLHPHYLSRHSPPALLRPWGTIRLHRLTLV